MLTNKVPEQDVHDLFTRVAPKYDLMNNIVSLGIQKSWRKKFLRQLDLNKNSLFDNKIFKCYYQFILF